MQVIFIYTGELGVWTPVSYGDSLKIEKDLELFKETFNSKRFKVIEFDDNLTISALLSYSNDELFSMGTAIYTDHMSLGKEPLEEKDTSVDNEELAESAEIPEPIEPAEPEESEISETNYSATDESKEFSGFYEFNSEDDEEPPELDEDDEESAEPEPEEDDEDLLSSFDDGDDFDLDSSD